MISSPSHEQDRSLSEHSLGEQSTGDYDETALNSTFRNESIAEEGVDYGGEEVDFEDIDDNDLVMDVLPETTRFTTMVSINRINMHMVDIDDEHLNDDFDDYDDEIAPGDDELSNAQPPRMEQLIVYVQRNSRLKLVLLSLEDASSVKDHYQIENMIRNVSSF